MPCLSSPRSWLPGDASPDRVKRLQRSQVANRPRRLHGVLVIEIGDPIREMFQVRLESMIRKRLDRRPKIPEGNLVLLCQTGNRLVDTVVPLQVVSFGGKDRHYIV